MAHEHETLESQIRAVVRGELACLDLACGGAVKNEYRTYIVGDQPPEYGEIAALVRSSFSDIRRRRG